MALAKMKLGARLPSIARRTLGRHSLALALFAVPLVSGTNLGGLSGGVHSLSGGQRSSEWLAPGKPTLTLEAADEMANAALSEVSYPRQAYSASP